MKKIMAFLFLTITYLTAVAQSKPTENLKWWNPAHQKAGIDGQIWPSEVEGYYDRFPFRAQKEVRKEVWDLSRNAAGLKLRFTTNAKTIKVRYTVGIKNYALDHFPATGRSGIDLYALNNDQTWAWASGKYKFGDTITYEFTNLDLDTKNYKNGRSYDLYLPIYNNLKWLEVGVPDGGSFEFLTPRKQKPIVVYGTSIAQGGCASRPGMAWTAILERDLHIPVVNLAFSGNGRLEPPVINLINEIDARVFVLDCLPNLNASTDSASRNVQKLILEAVKTLRTKHPTTPILLAEHSGFIENRLDAARRQAIMALNEASAKAFKTLTHAGVKNIFVLPSKLIKMGTDGTVDGTHPSDLGMYRYAQAYQQSISALLKATKTQ
jgi:hypothetical protein